MKMKNNIFINQIILFRDLFPESFSSALGLQSLTRVVMPLVFGIVGGYMKEYFNDFRACLFFLSASVLMALLIWIAVEIILRLKNKK